MSDSALVGVLVGGSLTLAGQVGLDVLRTKREARGHAADAKATARLQRDELWACGDAVAHLLGRREWWPEYAELPLTLGITERKTLASSLHEDAFRWIAYGLRSFLELRLERTAAKSAPDAEVGDATLVRAVWCYVALERARLQLEGLAEYHDNDIRPFPSGVDGAVVDEAYRRMSVKEPWPSLPRVGPDDNLSSLDTLAGGSAEA